MDATIKNLFKEDTAIKVNGSLWLQTGGIHFFGPGPVELLERINETGSINAAAKQMKMSYKKAWELVNTLNQQMKTPVVIPQTGGEKGGGSTLTAEAIRLIAYHREMRQRFAAFLENETLLLKA
jgi:molybdate transport system regulatory protein